MYPRLCKPLQKHSFFLFGARGTGKTKLIQQLLQGRNCLWVDLLRQGELLAFIRNPNELRERLAALDTAPEWVVIDEVQRIPEILNEVHSLIEEKKLKFALIGSSARKLRRGAANLLAGRALLNYLYPLTHEELGSDFNLAEVLTWGSLPAVVTQADPESKTELLKTYVETYLREEIREEQIIRRLDPFARFLESAAQSSGSILNRTKIGHEAGTDAKSVARYFQILEDTLLGFHLEPYHTSLRKRQRNQAKFFLFDIGVKRALEGSLRILIRPQTYDWGRTFEQFLVLEAHRLNSYYRANFRFSYLKTQGELEIDLIAERHGEKTWVIEIKSSPSPAPTQIRKLQKLANAVPNGRPIIWCTTPQPRHVDGVELVSWQDGLKQLFT